MGSPARAAIAAGLYLAVALFANRAVLTDPFALLPTPVDHIEREQPGFELVYEADQLFVVGYVARVARAFAIEPTNVADVGLCAPMTRAHTLGEHMFGQGLLGAIPYRLTGDPIFTFNAIAVLTTWISLCAMYALVFYFTRSASAAFVAGLLYALHPNRLNNPAHIFVFGNAWTALCLLAVHRLFDRERWSDALLLVLFLCLQLLESFYPVLALAIVGSTYGVVLSMSHLRRLPHLFPKLVVVAVAAGGFAWVVFGPYMETQGVWDLLQGRNRLLLTPRKYLPGQPASPGWILFILALLGLADRFRGARSPDDPRVPFFFAGFLVFWCSIHSLWVPGLGRLHSPLLALTPYVPGLGAVRALPALQFTVFLIGAVFAGYGALALIERVSPRPRVLLTVILAGAALLQTFHAPTSRASFAATPNREARRWRPPDEQIALLSRMPEGSVADIPLNFEPIMKLRMMPGYMLDAGYYTQPTAACYNSFLSDLQREVQVLVEQLPERSAAHALAALGFETLRVHHDRLPAGGAHITSKLKSQAIAKRLGRAGTTSAWRLPSVPTTSEFDAIAGRTDPLPTVIVDGTSAEIEFRFQRANAPAFRHPDPIEPSEVVVRWEPTGNRAATRSTGRMLLPAALAPGATAKRRVTVDVPSEPGPYLARLSRADDPDRILAESLVEVRPDP